MNILSKINFKKSLGAVAAITLFALIVILYMFNAPPTYPKFRYDSTDIDGWWSSENTNLQNLAKKAGGNYRGTEPIDRLPVADLTVHHGERDGDEAPEDSCFVGFSYYDYSLDGTEAAYSSYENARKEQGELKALNPREMTIITYEGEKAYDLRQYDFTVDGQEVLSGYQIGFVELGEGFVRVEGVCKTAEDLTLTQPVLEAVTLNES